MVTSGAVGTSRWQLAIDVGWHQIVGICGSMACSGPLGRTSFSYEERWVLFVASNMMRMQEQLALAVAQFHILLQCCFASSPLFWRVFLASSVISTRGLPSVC